MLIHILRSSSKVVLKNSFSFILLREGRIVGFNFRLHTTDARLSDSVNSSDSSCCSNCSPGDCHCPKCGAKLNSCCALFCTSEKCSWIQNLEKSQYKSLQRLIHPDMIAQRHSGSTQATSSSELKPNDCNKNGNEMGLSIANSAIINQAYRLLRSPVDRATYILSMNGIDLKEERTTENNTSLMMEMFELREQLEELIRRSKQDNKASDSAVSEYRCLLDRLWSQAESALSTQFQTGDFQAAARSVTRLKYIQKATEEFSNEFSI